MLEAQVWAPALTNGRYLNSRTPSSQQHTAVALILADCVYWLCVDFVFSLQQFQVRYKAFVSFRLLILSRPTLLDSAECVPSLIFNDSCSYQQAVLAPPPKHPASSSVIIIYSYVVSEVSSNSDLQCHNSGLLLIRVHHHGNLCCTLARSSAGYF